MVSSKLAVFGILLPFVLVFVFLVLFSIFGNLVFIILSLICLVLTIFFGILLAKDGSGNDLRFVIKQHKEKEALLSLKNEFQKQYMKRQLSEKQFNEQVLDLDKKILLIDYTIEFPITLENKDEELKRKKEFVQKQFFKSKISEELQNSLLKEFSKELAKK